jgi:hypothetical protein
VSVSGVRRLRNPTRTFAARGRPWRIAG